MSASIYDAFTQGAASTRHPTREPVVEIDADATRRQRSSGFLSPVSDRNRIPSRCSSLDNFSNPPSIYSPASTMTDLTDIGELNLGPRNAQDGGYESASSAQHGGRRHRSNVRAQMKNAEVLEEHADEDKASAHHHFNNTLRARNKSANSIASKIKADKVLGMPAPTTSVVSAYVCSGLGMVRPVMQGRSAYGRCRNPGR